MYSTTGSDTSEPDWEAMDPEDPTGLGLSCAAEFDVFGSGQHPMLQLADLGVSALPKSVAWSMANAGRINLTLGSALTPPELDAVRALAVGQASVTDVLKNLDAIDVLLPPGEAGGPDSVMRAVLRNTSDLDAQWSVSLPHETDLDMESWVQPRFPPDEIAEMEHLFDIRPRSGKLAPGEAQEVELRFRHQAPVERRLPLLMYVADGKCIRLELVGRTLEPRERCMAQTDTHHSLAPVELGRVEPPLQTVTLYNEGLSEVDFEIDTAPLLDLRASAWDFDVLRLLSPSRGVLPPRGHLVTWWSFSPVEARTYTARLPVLVGGEVSHHLVVSATGVAPSSPRDDLCRLAPVVPLLAAHRPNPPAIGLAELDAGDGGAAGPAGPELSLVALAGDDLGLAAEGSGAKVSIGGVVGKSGAAWGPDRGPRSEWGHAGSGRVASARPGTGRRVRTGSDLGLDEESGVSMGSEDLPQVASLRGSGLLLGLSMDVVDLGRMGRAERRAGVVVLHNRQRFSVRFRWSLGDYAPGAMEQFDGSVRVEPADGTIRPGERCMVRVEATAGAMPALFDGSVALEAEPLQAEVSPRDIARLSREAGERGGRATHGSMAASVRARPGVTGFVEREELSLDSLLSGAGAAPMEASTGEVAGGAGEAPAPEAQRSALRVIGEVHGDDVGAPSAAMLRRFALRELEEARR